MLFSLDVLRAPFFTELTDTSKPNNVQSTADTTPMFFFTFFGGI
jgi:hypothetical protein